MSDNHHYVSQFYQRFWSLNGSSVWAHYRQEKKSERVRTVRLMQEARLYTDPITGDDPLEHQFDRALESRVAPILKKMACGEFPDSAERDLVALFIATLEVRNPDARDLMLAAIREHADELNDLFRTDETQVQAWLSLALSDAQIPDTDLPTLLRQFVLRERGIHVDVGAWHDSIWPVATIFARKYADEQWTLLAPSGARQFFGSDAPVTTYSEQHGLALRYRYFHSDTPNTCTLLPLGPKRLLMIDTGHGALIGHNQLSDEKVDLFNKMIVVGAKQVVISGAEADGSFIFAWCEEVGARTRRKANGEYEPQDQRAAP